MASTKNFGLIGAAGYVAPRHMKAIVDTGNRLVAAMDPNDSVGIIDSYAPGASFFTEFERFDRHAEKLRRMGEENRMHYVSICSPNYLHDAHCRFALRIGADAICEKPLVLNPWNVDALRELEEETGQRIWNVLQLRLHPAIQDLKLKIDEERKSGSGRRHKVVLKYITRRGLWYSISWKGNINKSGGVVTNIGIHLFDALLWIFGACHASEVTARDEQSIQGHLELEHADVEWHLSIKASDLPTGSTSPAYRHLTFDGQPFDFSQGFNHLHTRLYQEIINGRGFTLEDALPAISLVSSLREGAV